MARLFDATGEVVSLGTIADLDAPSAFWVSAWVRMDALTQDGAVASTLDTNATGGTGGWLLFFDDTGTGGDRMDFFIYTAGAGNARVSSTAAVPVDEWHHWLGQYDPDASEMRLYKDGVLDNTTSSVVATPGSSEDGVRLGESGPSDSGTRELLGRLAEARAGLGVLTVPQIERLMAGKIPAVDIVGAANLVFDLALYGEENPEPDRGPHGHMGRVTGATYAPHPIPDYRPGPEPKLILPPSKTSLVTVTADGGGNKPTGSDIANSVAEAAHPGLWRNMTFATDFERHAGGLPRDIVNGVSSEAVDGWEYATHSRGQGIKFDASTDHLTWPRRTGYVIDGDVEFSVFVSLVKTGIVGSAPGLLTLRSAFSEGSWGLYTEPAHNVRFFTIDAGGFATCTFTNTALAGARTVGISRAVGGVYSLYIDGQWVANFDLNDTPTTANSHKLSVGALDTSADGNLNYGTYRSAYIWNGRALSAQDFSQLHGDNFLPLRKRQDLPMIVRRRLQQGATP